MTARIIDTDDTTPPQDTTPKKAPKKPKAPPAPKVLSLEKQREAVFTAAFLKPSVRRLGFWYKGIEVGHGANFVLGTVSEDKFAHGNPAHAISVVTIKNLDHVNLLDELFTAVGLMNDRIEIVNMKELATQCSKVKWDVTKLTFTRDVSGDLYCSGDHLPEDKPRVLISTALVSVFVLTGIKERADEFFRVLETNPPGVVKAELCMDDVPYHLVKIDADEVKAQSPEFAARWNGPIKAVVIRGLDLIQKKPFGKDAVVDMKFVAWHPYKNFPVADYMHVAETEDLRVAQSRCYVQLYPYLRKAE